LAQIVAQFERHHKVQRLHQITSEFLRQELLAGQGAQPFGRAQGLQPMLQR